MSYDHAKTRNLLTIVGAFASQPGGEYIDQLASQLRDAEAEIVAATSARTKAEGDANRYAAEVAPLQATIRQLREENESLRAQLPKPKKAQVGALDAKPGSPYAILKESYTEKPASPPPPAPELAPTGTAPAKRARKPKPQPAAQ